MKSRMLRSSRIDVLDEELRLAAHREAQVVLEVGEALAIARHRFERAELQPLAAEVAPRARATFGSRSMRRTCAVEHAGIAQRSGIGGPPQRRVRHARPQEVRQPGRQFVLRDRMRPSLPGGRPDDRARCGTGNPARRGAPGCRPPALPRTIPPPSARAGRARRTFAISSRRDRAAGTRAAPGRS